jgi:cytochrome oxidase Cu insertion factor (SCO1/SenC/PrrC family)
MRPTREAARGRRLCKFGAYLLVALLWAAAPIAAEELPSAEQLMDDLMWSRGPIGGPFTLTDHTGHLRSDTEFRGKLMPIYFGYTYCPDICPADLMTISQAVDALGEAGEAVQPVFITIDPERDTVERLADYVPSFHPRLIGLTGTPADIRHVALAYKAYYAKREGQEGEDYTVDHTGVTYLVGRDGQYLGFVPPQTTPERLVEVIRAQLGK